MPHVTFIHGLSNKPEAEALHRIWKRALAKGPDPLGLGNALLDHEGPPDGRPAQADVCRVHYRAPTAKGSSGSPVFKRSRWDVIALHHAGGTLSQPNGKAGTHLANEGIGLGSIARAPRARP